MADNSPDWDDLEPIDSLHEEILSLFQANPDTAYTAQQVADIIYDADDEEDVIFTAPANTICSDLSFQEYLEVRIDDAGKEYFRLNEE